MKKVLLVAAALVLLTSAMLTAGKLKAEPAGAATAPITVTGSIVAGMKTAQSGVPVMLQFKVTNDGSTTFDSGGYFMSYFVPSNAAVITSVECIQNGTGILHHYDIGAAASNACQLQALPAHTSGGGAIDLYTTSSPPSITVKACVGARLNSQTYCGSVIVPMSD